MQTERREQFPIPADRYWQDLCLNLDFQERLFREGLGCETIEVVRNEGSYGVGLHRHLRFVKASNAPAALRKVLGEKVTVEEIGEFDPHHQRWSFRILPGVMADKLAIEGTITLEDGGNGSVVEVVQQTFVCSLFGIGGLVERFIAKSLEEGERARARYAQTYIREKTQRDQGSRPK
jgi:hypothetical protein